MRKSCADGNRRDNRALTPVSINPHVNYVGLVGTGAVMEEVVRIVAIVLRVLSIAIIAQAILSFLVPVMGDKPHPIIVNINLALRQITEPLLGPIRRVLPTIGMLDLSPMVAIIVLEIIRSVLVRSV